MKRLSNPMLNAIVTQVAQLIREHLPTHQEGFTKLVQMGLQFMYEPPGKANIAKQRIDKLYHREDVPMGVARGVTDLISVIFVKVKKIKGGAIDFSVIGAAATVFGCYMLDDIERVNGIQADKQMIDVTMNAVSKALFVLLRISPEQTKDAVRAGYQAIHGAGGVQMRDGAATVPMAQPNAPSPPPEGGRPA
jgi:hypothetical protein